LHEGLERVELWLSGTKLKDDGFEKILNEVFMLKNLKYLDL